MAQFWLDDEISESGIIIEYLCTPIRNEVFKGDNLSPSKTSYYLLVASGRLEKSMSNFL